MKTAKQYVIDILRVNPQARNDDRELFLAYFREHNLQLTQEQEAKFRTLPYDLETLRRSRQVVQNDENQLQATSGIKKKRLQKEGRIREARMTKQWIFHPETQSYSQV